MLRLARQGSVLAALAGLAIGCSDVAEDPSRATSALERPLSDGPVVERLRPLRRATIGEESRLVMPAPVSAHRIRIGPGSRVSVSFGVTDEAPDRDPGPIRFRVGFTPPGTTTGRKLVDVVLSRSRGKQRWHDYSFPFGGEHHRAGDLALSAKAEGPVDGIAVFGIPRVTPPPSSEADARPDILLLSLDTLRADHLGAWGHPRATSPAIDRIAANGVRFADAVAPSSWTLPSHASMLTGLDPASHGAVAFRESTQLGKDVITVAERLWLAGYETGGMVGGGWLTSRHGFDRGFETYSAARDMFVFPGQLERSLRRARRWLSSRREGAPVFLFIHTYQVHMPLTPPRPYDRMFDTGPQILQRRTLTFEQLHEIGLDAIRRPLILSQVKKLYDAEIRYVDDLVGVFLEKLPRIRPNRDLCVIITSDHGEAFGEHGHLFHDRADLGQALLHVPLIVWCPGRHEVSVGRVVDAPVGVVDVAPTILDLASVDEFAGLDGRSLVPGLGGDAGAPAGFVDRVIHSDVDLTVEARRAGDPATGDFVIALRRGSHKLVYRSAFDSRELFDLASDPGESRDLAQSHPELLAAFAPVLETAIERRRALPLPLDSGAPTLPDAGLEQLRALGYFE